MGEHEHFGRPPNLRPRSAGARAMASAWSVAPEQLAREATRANAAAALSERLRPVSATARAVARADDAPLRPAMLLSKPPARPRSAMLGARGIVSQHRLELLKAQQPEPSGSGDNQARDATPRASTELTPQLQRAISKAEKHDALSQASAVVGVDRARAGSLKRPFSAAPSIGVPSHIAIVPERVLNARRPDVESVGVAGKSNQDESTAVAPRLKRPFSAAAAMRGSSPRTTALQTAANPKSDEARTQSTNMSSAAIAIMSSYQRDTFVYAVPRHCLERGRQYNPYDIVTISHEALYGVHLSSRSSQSARYDFYTVSPTGMTFHCKDDNFEPSFLTAAEWERQKACFFRICKLRTFQMFRYRKFFLGWKKWIRSTKIEIARTVMLSSLYFSQPVLSAGMKAIRTELVKLDDLNLMCDLNGETLHLSHLSAKNRDYVQSQGMEILKVSGSIQQILLQVCQECLSSTENPYGGFPGHEFALSTRKSSNFHIFEAFVERERTLATANHQLVQHHHFQSAGPMQTSKVSLSTAAQLRTTQRKYMERVIRAQQQRPQDALDEIRWTLAAIQRRRCLSLTKFVSLVDFMVLDALHSLLTRSIQLLRDGLWIGSNAVPISRLIDRRDYVLAFHKTLKERSHDATSDGSRIQHTHYRSSSSTMLNKQQLKRFLRWTWEAKLPGILRVKHEDGHDSKPGDGGDDIQQIKSSAAVWLESRLDSLFLHALRENCGASTELFSFDDAMSVVEQTLANALVLPDFDASVCSIAIDDSKDFGEGMMTEDIASLVLELQQIESLRPVALLHMSMTLRVDGRSNKCDIVFKPGADQVPKLVEEILSSFVDLFQGIPSVILHQELRAILQFAGDFRASSIVQDGSNDDDTPQQGDTADGDDEEESRWSKSNFERLSARIANDNYCLMLRVNIDELVKSTIVGASAFTKSYDDILATFTRNENIVFETYRMRFRSGDYSLRDMEAEVRGFHSQVENIARLKVSQTVEFLQFDMTQLKEALSPSPARCLQQLHALLPALALEKCESFLVFVRAACKKIEKPSITEDLDAFARYLLHVRDVQDDVQEKDFDLTFIHDMFSMLERLDIGIPADVGETFNLCEPEFEALKSQVNEAMAKKDADILERSPILAQNIKSLQTSIEVLKTNSADQAINSADSVSSDARIQANGLEKYSETLIEKSAQLVWFQRVFSEFSQGSRPPVEEFNELHAVSNELKLKNELWEAINDTEEYLDTKRNETLRDIDLGQLRSILLKVEAVIKRLQQSAFQIAAIKRLESSKAILEGLSPVIRDLRNENLEERHWTKLEHKMSCSFVRSVSPSPEEDTEEGIRDGATDAGARPPKIEVKFLDLPLQHLLEIQAVNHATLIHQVSEEATAEAAIMKSFQSVSQTWEHREIPSFQKKDRDGRDSIGLGECNEILTLLEESEVLLRVMESSSFARVIHPKLVKLLGDLAHTKESMELLVVCQQKREHLQRLVSADFVRSFPEQSKALQSHDSNWKAIMEGISKRPLCLPFGTNTEYRQLLQTTLHGFEVASQYVEQHLEMKRQLFPGFFKLSNSELSTLLSKVRDINSVQQFLFQCFDNVGRINFGTREACQDVLSITSRALPVSETIPMGRNLKARGPPEQWLVGIEKRLTEMLRKTTKEAVALLSQPLSSSPIDVAALQGLPMQCVLLADRILRSELIDSVLTDADGPTSSEPLSLTTQNNVFTKLRQFHTTMMERIFSSSTRDGQSASLMSPREILLLSGLNLHEIEFRDAVDEHIFAAENPVVTIGSRTSRLGVHWQLQPKHRFDDTTTVGYDCHVEIGGARVSYGFNYINPTADLVFTPRSMRFVFSIFAATRHGQTVILTGPACSGKQSLAIQASRLFGRRFFGFVASDSHSRTQSFCAVAHCLKLIRGALLAGGVLCVGLRMQDDVANLFRVLASTATHIKHSVLCRLPIAELQSDPITWIPGTTLIFTCASLSPSPSAVQRRFDVATSGFSRLVVVATHDMTIILEALMHSKQYEAPRHTAKKLVLLWSHLSSIDSGNQEAISQRLFTMQTAKQVVTTVAEDIWKNAEPFEREALQSLFICEAVLNLCTPLSLVGCQDGEDPKKLIVAALNHIFQYNTHEGEWYNRQWKRTKASSLESTTKKLEEMVDEAAQELHFLPRRQLVSKSIELATGLTRNVGVVMIGPSGAGKSTTCGVLSQALSKWKSELVAECHARSSTRESGPADPVLTQSKATSAVEATTVTSAARTSDISSSGPFVDVHVVLPMSLTLSQLLGDTGNDSKGQIKSLLGRLIRDAQDGFAIGSDHETQYVMSKTAGYAGLGSMLAMHKLTWVVFDGGAVCGGEWLDVLLTVLSRKFVFGLIDSCAHPNRELVRFADGEFMTIPPNLRFVFDTWSLENASPAVLPHCAFVVFVPEEVVDLDKDDEDSMPIHFACIQRFIDQQRIAATFALDGAALSQRLVRLSAVVYDTVTNRLLGTDILVKIYAVIEDYGVAVHISLIHRVDYMLAVLQALLSTVAASCASSRKPEDGSSSATRDIPEEDVQQRAEMAIVYALLWGFSACCVHGYDDSRSRTLQLLISGIIKTQFDIIGHTWEDCGRDANLFELLMDINGLRFVSVESGDSNILRDKLWRHALSSSTSGLPTTIAENQFHSLFIPTASSLIIHAAMKEAIRSARGILLVGSDTSRKTTLLQSFLKQLESLRVLTSSNYASIPVPAATNSTEASDGSNAKRKRGVALLRAPLFPQADNAYASLDRIRVHQVGLVKRLAKRFRKVNKAAAAAAALAAAQRYGGSKSKASANTVNGDDQKTKQASKKEAEWALRPHLETSKTEMVSKFDRGDFIPFFFAMSQHDRGVQELAKCLERMLQRERSGIYEPPPGKTAVLIIDDLHLPVVTHDEEHPSCHEYLRSAYEHSTVLNTTSEESGATAVTIESLMMVASISSRAMSPGTTANREETPLKTSHFSLDKLTKQFLPVYAPSCSLLELHTIFHALAVAQWERMSTAPLDKLSSVVRQLLPVIVAATTVLWERLRRRRQTVLAAARSSSNIPPALNLHDLKRVHEGICAVEPSYIIDGETLARLWAHETIKTLSGVTLPHWKAMVKSDVFRIRILLDGLDNQMQGSGVSTMASPTAGLNPISTSAATKVSTTIGSTNISLQAGEVTRLTNLNTKTNATGLVSFFSSELLDTSEKKTATDLAISQQQRLAYERKKLHVVSLWAFVPASLYYQTSNGGGASVTQAGPTSASPLQRRNSIKFMRRKSMENVVEGAANAAGISFGSAGKAASLGNARWIYAELALSEDVEVGVDEVAVQIAEPIFSSIRIFSAVSYGSLTAKPVTDLVLQTQAAQISRQAPAITPLMVRNIATLERVFTPQGSRSLLRAPVGSGRSILVQYACVIRQASQPQSMWTVEGVADAEVMIKKWKHVVHQLFERVGVDYEGVTLVVKRLPLWPQQLISQLLALMVSGEISGAFSLEEQIKLATRVRDERLIDLEQRYQAQVARIRHETEMEKDHELLARREDNDASKVNKTGAATHYQELERKYQHTLLIRLTQVQLRHQQEMDDFLRKCEVENESVTATIMSLMRPLGMTSGKWQQIVQRMRKRLRIVVIADDDEIQAIETHAPRLLRICNVASLSPMDGPSLQTLLYGSFRSEVQNAFRHDLSRGSDGSVDGVRKAADERAQLSHFVDRVEHELGKVTAVAAEMHDCATVLAAEENRKVSTEFAVQIARLFARLLRSHYWRGREDRRKAEWFIYVYSSMEKALWKLQDRDGELQAQLESCDQQIEVSQELLTEQKEDCDRIRDMMKRYQESAEDQVQVTNEMELRAQAELHVPMACLEEANAALLMIDKRHIIEIKSFNSPPLLVHFVLDAICVMFQLEPAWENARKILSDPNVVHTLLTFDKDNISDEVLSKIETTYIYDPRFHREEVEKQSVAASMMVVWVRAMYQYATARRQVLPTLEKLEQAQTRLRLLMQEYQVSKQRVIDADEALAKTKDTLEKAHEQRRRTVDEMESRKMRLDGGRVVLECLVEDKREADRTSKHLEKESKLGLIWWNALLSAGALVYSNLFDASDRVRLYEEWGRALRRSVGEGSCEDDDNESVDVCLVPAISVVAKEDPSIAIQQDTGASAATSDVEFSSDPIALFNRRGRYWEFASACGFLFSKRSLQDAFLLTQTSTAGFPVIMVTSYTSEMEDLIVRCARYVWKWTQFFMVSANAADLHTTVATAVKEGHQLLILDVEPLDIEYKLGKLWSLFHWSHERVATSPETGEAVEHLIFSAGESTESPETPGDEGKKQTSASIPVHPEFRAVLSTYQDATAFGDVLLTQVPVVSAHQHTSDVAGVLLDRLWYPGLFEGGQHGFGLKQSVRDYERLRRQQDDAETQLTKLIQGAAVRGQFQRDESDLIRLACRKTKDLREMIEQKHREVQERIKMVEKHMSMATLGASLYNGLNAVGSRSGDHESSKLLSLHVFLPVFLSALKKSPTNTLTTHPFTRLESSGAPHGNLQRTPSQLKLQSQGSVRSLGVASPRGNGFDTVGEIIKKVLQQVMPLVRDVSDWYKFILHVLWLLESQYEVEGLAGHPAALEATVNYVGGGNTTSLPCVRRVLSMTKLSHWKSNAQCQDYEAIPAEINDTTRLVSLVVNGYNSNSSVLGTQSESTDLTPVFAASRCRAERVKTTVSVYPGLVRVLCDTILQLYGVQVTFTLCELDDQAQAVQMTSFSPTKSSVRDVSEQLGEQYLAGSEPARVRSGWLRSIDGFPASTCVAVRSDHRFGSYEFLHRVFYATVSALEGRAGVLKAALSRSFRCSGDLVEVFFLPNQRLQSSDARGNHRSALSMMGENSLMVRNLTTLLEMERHKLDTFLDDVPLAIVNLQEAGEPLRLLTSWEDLYHIINSSPEKTTSMELRRFESASASRSKGPTSGAVAQPDSSKGVGAVALSVATRNAAARRFSTQNLQHRRSDAASFLKSTTVAPSFVTVVRDLVCAPQHLRDNTVAFAAEATELGTNRVPSFKKSLQETLVCVAHHPCGDMIRQLTMAGESSTTAKDNADTTSEVDQEMKALSVQLWHHLSVLITFHALLAFRWQLSLRQYTVNSSSAELGLGRYSFDVLTTALDQLLLSFLQMRSPNKAAPSFQQRSETLQLRVRQQVFVPNYTRQASAQQEVSVVRLLCRECLNLIPDASRARADQLLATANMHPSLLSHTAHPPGINSARSVRSHRILHAGNSSMALPTATPAANAPAHGALSRRASVRRASGDVGAMPLLAGLNLPLDKMESSAFDTDQWIDTMWAYTETVDGTIENLVRESFGLLTPVEPNLSAHPDANLERTPWRELFGWVKYPVRYGSVASQISLEEALRCLELIQDRVVPPLIDFHLDSQVARSKSPTRVDHSEDGDSDCDSDGEKERTNVDGDGDIEESDTQPSSSGSPKTQDQPTLTEESARHAVEAGVPERLAHANVFQQQIFRSCCTNYNSHVHALRETLQGSIDALLFWKGLHNERTSHREQTLAGVADQEVVEDVLAVLCDQVPARLENRLAASPTYLIASGSVSLDALVAQYQYSRRNLQEQHSQLLLQDEHEAVACTEWWLPGVPARLSIPHLLELAKRSSAGQQESEPDARGDELVFSILLEQELERSSEPSDANDISGDADTSEAESDSADPVYPEGTIAVFSGLELRLATWDSERGYLQSLDRHSARVPQRVRIICQLEKRSPVVVPQRTGSGTSATFQHSVQQLQAKRQRATRSCPLLLGGDVAHEFELPIGPAFGVLVVPYLALALP